MVPVKLEHLLPNPNALVAISKDMRTVNIYSKKILQFLTVDAVRSPYGLRPCASPAGEQPISTHACYRIIPGQAQRVHLCPL